MAVLFYVAGKSTGKGVTGASQAHIRESIQAGPSYRDLTL
jgi:hypothetical protein